MNGVIKSGEYIGVHNYGFPNVQTDIQIHPEIVELLNMIHIYFPDESEIKYDDLTTDNPDKWNKLTRNILKLLQKQLKLDDFILIRIALKPMFVLLTITFTDYTDSRSNGFISYKNIQLITKQINIRINKSGGSSKIKNKIKK